MSSTTRLVVLVLVSLFALLTPSLAAAPAAAAPVAAVGAAPAGAAAQAAGAAASASAAADEISITYTMQTGLTRYAPMQTQPGKTITAKSASMQYPTSSWSVFKTYAPEPSVQTTVTASWTYAVTSKINTAAAQSLDTAALASAEATEAATAAEAMAKYLARWKD